MTELIRQRFEDDCTLCCIAMATGLAYETVLVAALFTRMGYRPGNGTRSAWWVLHELGFEARVINQVDCPPRARAMVEMLWRRPAIVSLPTLNGWKGWHDVYWDGRQLFDPSTKPNTYAPDALETVDPLDVVILDERSE